MQQITKTPMRQTHIAQARYDFLRNEIARWQEENIVNRAQGDEILARYSAEGGKQHGLLVLFITGACILAISLMLLISTNWKGVDVQAKALAVMALMLFSYISAWTLRSKSPLKTVISESLVFLGCVLFGAGTILTAQHFHVTGNQPELLLWAMGIAPIVVLFRSHASALLLAGILAYRAVQPSGAGFSFDWLVVLSGLSAIYCAYYTRSQVALALGLCASAAALCCTKHSVDEFSLLFFGIACFIAHLFHQHERRWHVMSTPHLLVSFLLVLGSLVILISDYSLQSMLEKTSITRVQTCAILDLLLLGCLVKTSAAKTGWPIVTAIFIIASVIVCCLGLETADKHVSLGAFFAANLLYLFYIASMIENRLIQFVPVASLTIFALIFVAMAPGGAMLGSGITFAVGLVLMICSFAALGRSMRAACQRRLN